MLENCTCGQHSMLWSWLVEINHDSGVKVYILDTKENYYCRYIGTPLLGLHCTNGLPFSIFYAWVINLRIREVLYHCLYYYHRPIDSFKECLKVIFIGIALTRTTGSVMDSFRRSNYIDVNTVRIIVSIY